jgi:hypothetical protein
MHSLHAGHHLRDFEVQVSSRFDEDLRAERGCQRLDAAKDLKHLRALRGGESVTSLEDGLHLALTESSPLETVESGILGKEPLKQTVGNPAQEG